MWTHKDMMHVCVCVLIPFPIPMATKKRTLADDLEEMKRGAWATLIRAAFAKNGTATRIFLPVGLDDVEWVSDSLVPWLQDEQEVHVVFGPNSRSVGCACHANTPCAHWENVVLTISLLA